MSSNITILIIVFIVFGSAGVMFLMRAFRDTSSQNDYSSSKTKNLLDTFNTSVFLIVGGWFIIVVVIGICLMVTHFL